MTKKVPVRVNVDDNLKREAEDLYQDLGMNMSTAITIFLKQSVREQAIPFKITKNELSTTSLEALKEVEEGKVTGPFKNIKDLMRSLDA